ncbi:MAG TPA: GxxExxY protein [Anaerolineaceae bacterium]|nr:GxxExxY protein [Anaerolineaceae bacterium]HPN52864.1 GxxExxY protein [Anaerolineaceae bacterium]
MPLLFRELTSKIISAYLDTYAELKNRPGYNEHNCTRSLCIELGNRGLQYQEQVPFRRMYKGCQVGGDFLDLVIENKVLAQVKKVQVLRKEHYDQARTYLFDSGLAVGFLFNFGSIEPEYSRLYEKRNDGSQ